MAHPSDAVASVGPAPRARTGVAPVRGVLAAAGGLLVAVLAGLGLVLQVVNGGAEAPNGNDYLWGLLFGALAFGVPGAAMLARRRAPVVGALSLAIGLCGAVTGALTGWTVHAFEHPPAPAAADWAVWVTNWLWLPGYSLVPALLLVLPDGRLPSRRAVPIAVALAIAVVAGTLGMALSPYPSDDLPRAFAGAEHPAEAETLGRIAAAIGIAALVPGAALSLASLVLRLRRSRGVEREQLKWVALGGTGTLTLLVAGFFAGEATDAIFAAAWLPLPAGVAVAVLRHGLWNVDVVLSRSLAYAALTVLVVAGYVALVALAGLLLERTAAGVLAAAIVAVALQPLHGRVQAAANRLVFGDRDDPSAALRRLGDRLVATGDGDSVLTAAAETVAHALRLPYVAVRLDDGPEAEHGTPREAAVTLELLYRGERVGELVVAPRDGAGLSRADRRALAAIGRQVAVAAHGVRLTGDLRRSRERLVLAREEERRRLRHDLHDDLGPTLAGLALELEAARDAAAGRDPDTAAALERASARARQSVADVRRLVHELRPPTLDDLGLVGAVRERARHFEQGGLATAVETTGDLGELPAAVEAAGYRIVSEALANVARHAKARRCTVELRRTAHALELAVRDDGVGLGREAGRGVGLASMRERAEELGGTLTVDAPAGGGTQVVAVLPLGDA